MDVSLVQVMRGALKGKTIGRILFNGAVRVNCAALFGRVLDLAGGEGASYLPLLPKGVDLVRTNYRASKGVMAVDFNAPLPFSDHSFDAVLLFSALYISEDPDVLAREVIRVLKPGGLWLISSPFVANEMPEPHDYVRFTAEGLERLCRGAGFVSVGVERIGERATAATQLLQPFFLFNIVRALVFPFALFLDRLVPRRVRHEHPTPLSYFVRAVKGGNPAP